MSKLIRPRVLILNQMAGPLTWEMAEGLGQALGAVALLTGHPDTLQKQHPRVFLRRAVPYQRGGYARRALSWLRYWLQALVWVWSQSREARLLVFSNPPMLCWLGYLLRKLRGQKYMVMVHDIYPDVLVALAKLSTSHWLVRLWRILNRRAYENAEIVMTLSEGMSHTLANQFDASKTPGKCIEVIYPWVDTDVIKPMAKEQNWFAQKYHQVGVLTVMYAGNMGIGHDIETMLGAARRLQYDKNIHFLFVGDGPKWKIVESTVRDFQLFNVTLLPWQIEAALPYVLATADVGLVTLEDSASGLAVPSKTFYMMAAGAAVVGLSRHSSDLQQIIEGNASGYNIEPGDADGLVEVIRKFRQDESLLESCRQRARQAAETKFSRLSGLQQVLRVGGLE